MSKEVIVYGLMSAKFGRFKYIGITTNSLHTRRLEHIRGKKLDAADITIVEIARTQSKEEAAKLEAELIKQYDTIHNGWNISPYTTKGNANAKSEEERARISAAMKGRPKPKEEVLARVGNKKRNNGLPPNVIRSKNRTGFLPQIVGILDGKKSTYTFGTYQDIETATTIAEALISYAKENNMVLDGFTHPLYVHQRRRQTPKLYGLTQSKYGTWNVGIRCKVNKKLYNFKSWKTFEQAVKVRDAAVAYYEANGTFEGFVVPN